ncbi:hypothetical protein ElyMa_000555200 [Elysia marginata]|uniref:Uncharacterized protein n=1 Tax=Elysia marginata TaxID=1093978 RepID=A0AAV4G330_9GAST|nr:hypothetical protein ElyMa_000555200 [Elysia marginata]
MKAESQEVILQTDQVKTTTPQSDSLTPDLPQSLLVKSKVFMSQLFKKKSKTDTDLAGIESSAVKSPSSIASSNASDIADLTSLEEESSNYTVNDIDSQPEPIDTLDTSDVDSGYDEYEWDDDDDDFEEWSDSNVETASPSNTYENISDLNAYENISRLQTHEHSDALVQPDVDEKAATTESPQESSSHTYENLRILNASDATPVIPDSVTAPKPPEVSTETDALNNPEDEQGNSSMSAFEASIKAAVEARELRQKAKKPDHTKAQNTAISGKTNSPENRNAPPLSSNTAATPAPHTEGLPEKKTDAYSEPLSQTDISEKDVTLPKTQEPKDDRALMLEAIRTKQYNLNRVDKTVAPPNTPKDIGSTTNKSITARREAFAGNLAEEIEELFDAGYYPDADSEEAKELIEEVKSLILDNSDLLPKQAQEAAQKIYGLKNKIVGEIEDIIDEMRS